MNRCRYRPILALVFGAFLLSGCVGGVAGIAGTAAGMVAKPVFGLVDRDAKTANAWINVEVAAGRLSEAEAAEARLCPDAVLALSAIREEVTNGSKDVEGFKGVIYHAIKARFGQSLQVEIAQHIQTIAGRCAELLPVEKLVQFF